MELLYIWIYQVNNVYQKDINFNSLYKFNYNDSSNTIFGESLMGNRINLFNDQFLNINAIIGENGCGKSSILSYFNYIFSREFSYFGRNTILVIKESETIKIFHNIKGLNFKITSFQFEEANINTIESNVDLIHFSNSFSIYDEVSHGNVVNLSLTKSLYDAHLNSNRQLIERYDGLLKIKDEMIESKNYEESKQQIINYAGSFSYLYTDELTKIIKLKTDHDIKDFDFIPFEAEIVVNSNFIWRNRVFLKNIDDDLFKQINLLAELNYNQTSDQNKKKEYFKNSIILLFFVYIEKYNLFSFTTRNNSNELISELKQSSTIKYTEIILKFIQDSESLGIDNYFIKIKEFLTSFDSKIDILNFTNSEYSFTPIVELNNDFLTFNREIYSLWEDKDPVFLHSWLNLSAGQSALLRIFARLNDIKPFNNTIWLLIDEGDLYLHPEWQRIFFNDLHKYLPKFYVGKKIQLFLTSHSPFLVSDLPKENILFLKRDDNGLSEIRDIENLSQTFGANIHLLYNNSFFLEKGLIGEFAKEKIEELIKSLKKPSDNAFDIDSSKQLINIIGEPFLKQKLMEMHDEKFKDELRLKFLESEVERLKAKK